MLDLNTIFGMREQMLPQEGFLGFLLKNWLIIAIVVMILGFVIDQVLYVVRYRPQDKWASRYHALRRFIARKTGKEIEEPPEAAADEPQEHMIEQPPAEPQVPQPAHVDQDAPVIRRGGARYVPSAHRPQEPAPQKEAPAPARDEDAPMVVRAAAPRRPNDPDTLRGESQH